MGKSTEVQTDGKSLLKAVYLSRLRLTRLLLEGGAYINESNDQGETPLMVACKSHHTDVQSVPKHKIVRYLLENGADPNIQDKTGKTALMHACLEQAGPEILSLLLSSGADPTLEDQAGLSALVYAVSSGNKEVLSVLLDACKAKGKEVIIITTNKLLSGHQLTKQYLNVPPPSDVDKCLPPCETHLQSPPQGPSGSASPPSGSPLFGHRDPETSGSGAGLTTSRPASAIQHLSAFRIPFMDKLLQQSRSSSLTEVVDITPESELCFRVSGLASLGRPPPVSSDPSIDVKDATELLTAQENMSGINSFARRGRRSLGRKMSYDSATSSAHSSSHPNWYQNGSLPFPHESTAVVEDSSDFLPQMNVSSLQNIVAWRNIGLDHYSSDSQLPQFGSSYPSSSAGVEAKAEGEERSKLSNSKSSTLCGSRESLESFKHRRNAAVLDRRGSGALLLDHISHTRPGYLPPLNPHAPIPDIGVSPASSYLLNGRSKTLNGVLTGSKPSLPSATHFLRDIKDKKMLWRRHSMQSEQINQLAMFEETFGQ
ncbi:ankyrin repeat domain 34Bb [Genypterus blacodes]|uniref:ankyrin repeat domain 34Bb n=1 Tax=Genypterus blacodes TaxID=154954 RepID=UPI003F76EF73